MKNIFIRIVVFISIIFSSAYAQNRLQIADTIRDETGMLRYFKISKKEPVKRLADAENVLQAVFNPDKSIAFKLVKTKTGSDNKKSLLYQQTYNGVPVYDGYYYLHFMNNIFTEANGEYTAIKKVINAINLKKTDAINSAIKHISFDKSIQPSSADGELTLWRNNREEDYRYVYKVEVNYPDAQQSRECMVDAATGEVLIAVPVVCYTNVTCSGTTVYSGTRNFTGDSFSGGVRLRETRNGVSIKTMNNQNNVNVNAVDFVNATTTWTSAGTNEGALDVHFGVERFLDYFSTVFSRNSIDGSGHSITCYTNRWWHNNFTNTDEPMDNAFFNRNDITFSFGQGNVWFNSVTSLDAVAHELGHGIAYYETGFNTTGEASALNERFSDIWGATVENWSALPGKETWTMNEEIMANGFSCSRSLRSPTTEGFLPGFSTEGHYPDTRFGPNWNTSDPHINATVLGHWYFLLSQAGSGTNGIGNPFSVAGLGINVASQIAYHTELALTPSADFNSVRVASIAYTAQKYGANSCEVASVTNAWYAVGVGDAYSGTLGMAIQGDNNFCTTSGTYAISNLPAGATVTWSVMPTGVVTINSPNAAQTTLAKNYDGIFTLKATVGNTCSSSPVVVTKPHIVSGFPDYGGPNGADVAWPYGNYRYYVNLPIGFPPASSYYWQIPAGWTILSGQGTNELYLRTGATAGAVEVIVTACGISRPTYKWVEVGYGDIQPDFTGPGMYRLSPNPAVSSVTIAAVNASGASKETASFTAIAVRDVTGVARKQYRYTSGARKAQIDVSDLLPGVYYVEICSSTGVKRMPFIVVR